MKVIQPPLPRLSGGFFSSAWVAHAAAKRALVAKQRIHRWTAPGMFRPPEALTEAEVVEAEAELKALSRHALEVVNPKGGNWRE